MRGLHANAEQPQVNRTHKSAETSLIGRLVNSTGGTMDRRSFVASLFVAPVAAARTREEVLRAGDSDRALAGEIGFERLDVGRRRMQA